MSAGAAGAPTGDGEGGAALGPRRTRRARLQRGRRRPGLGQRRGPLPLTLLDPPLR